MIQNQNESEGNIKFRAERICELRKVNVSINKLYLYSYASDKIDL